MSVFALHNNLYCTSENSCMLWIVFVPASRWKLRFIRSEFRGQLPQPYSPHKNATWVIPDHMNDMNLEETSRYVRSMKLL